MSNSKGCIEKISVPIYSTVAENEFSISDRNYPTRSPSSFKLQPKEVETGSTESVLKEKKLSYWFSSVLQKMNNLSLFWCSIKLEPGAADNSKIML